MTNPDPDAVLTDEEVVAHLVRAASNIHGTIICIPPAVWALRNVTDFTTLTTHQREQYRALQVLAETIAAATFLSTGLTMTDPDFSKRVIRSGLRALNSPRMHHLTSCTGETP